MSSLVLTGSTSGTVSVQAPAVAGSNTATIGAATGTHYPFTAGTAVASTSGTSIDFTSIPSWVKRITVMFQSVSTNGTSFPQVQIGSGSVTTSGYSGYGVTTTAGSSTSGQVWTTGFGNGSAAAANVWSGMLVLTNVTGNTWLGNTQVVGLSSGSFISTSSVSITLGGTLDRVRITTVNGTDTFDAGSINILYE